MCQCCVLWCIYSMIAQKMIAASLATRMCIIFCYVYSREIQNCSLLIWNLVQKCVYTVKSALSTTIGKSFMELSTVYACAFLVMVKIIKELNWEINIQWYSSIPCVHTPWYMWKLRGSVIYYSWLVWSYRFLQTVPGNCRPLWHRCYIIHFEGIGKIQYSSSNTGPSEGCTVLLRISNVG